MNHIIPGIKQHGAPKLYGAFLLVMLSVCTVFFTSCTTQKNAARIPPDSYTTDTARNRADASITDDNSGAPDSSYHTDTSDASSLPAVINPNDSASTLQQKLPPIIQNLGTGAFTLKDGKTALVLEGCGARGSYEIGVYRALLELGIPIDIVTGTSSGALNAAFIVQQQPEKTYKLWTEIENSMVYVETEATNTAFSERNEILMILKALCSGEPADSAPLYDLLADTLDLDAFYDSPIDFGLVTVRKKTLKECRMTKETIPRDKLVDYLMASCSFYPILKSYSIDGVEYIDGGYRNSIPIDLAVELGATNVIAVYLGLCGIISADTIKALATENVLVITPSAELGSILDFDGARAQWNMELGYIDTMVKFGKVIRAKEQPFQKWIDGIVLPDTATESVN